jgi:hypothetical protein
VRAVLADAEPDDRVLDVVLAAALHRNGHRAAEQTKGNGSRRPRDAQPDSSSKVSLEMMR